MQLASLNGWDELVQVCIDHVLRRNVRINHALISHLVPSHADALLAGLKQKVQTQNQKVETQDHEISTLTATVAGLRSTIVDLQGKAAHETASLNRRLEEVAHPAGRRCRGCGCPLYLNPCGRVAQHCINCGRRGD